MVYGHTYTGQHLGDGGIVDITDTLQSTLGGRQIKGTLAVA